MSFGVGLCSFGFGVGFFFTIESIHGADDNEDDEGDDEKVDDVLEEIPVGDVGSSIGTKDIRDVDGKRREIETASK